MQDRVMSQMKDAMRAKDRLALTALRSLKAALSYASIDTGEALSEDASLAVVRTQVKQHEESATGYADAGRADEAADEQAKLVILRSFLPRPLSEEELLGLIDAAMEATGASSMRDMGAVMKHVNERAAGRAEGRVLSGLVRGRLQGA